MDPIPTCRSRDIFSRPWLAFLVFWLPAIAIVAAGTQKFTGRERAITWAVALATMGVACLVNALRCRRVHCYLTGPFFLLMAFVSLSCGLNILPLGAYGWNLIGLTVLVGAIVLCCVPEVLLGKYRAGRTGGGDG
jgi:hypothetical protein